MRKIAFIFLLLFVVKFSFAQLNLVSNPSFEIYSTCPSATDELSYSIGWSSYSISPDYFNSCSGTISVPSNGIGYQFASSGVAYAGFQAYDINGFAREIIGGLLSQNLLIGQKYFVTIKVSLAEFNSQSLPCDKVGVKFSTVPYSASSPVPINNFAQVYSNTIIGDTINWTTVRGSFIADSSYQYVMIGNFFDDSQTDTMSVSNGIKSYYFLDDICVSTDSLLCNNFNSISEDIHNEAIQIYPNPSDGIIFIDSYYPFENSLLLFSVVGEKIAEKTFINQTSIDLSDLANGIYFIYINSNKKTIAKKIIISHNNP